MGVGIPMVFWQGGAEYLRLGVVDYGKDFDALCCRQDRIDITTGRTQYPLLFCCVCLKQRGLRTVLHELTP